MYDLRPGDPEQIGEFAVVGRLGGGGMGTVYLAEAHDGTKVAIKVVHEYLATDPEFRRRFGHEVEAASKISGTYTAEVLTADPDARLPWMATEFVEGRNLLQTIEAEGPMPPEQVLRLAAGVADALTEIHRAGVIHRDLKPSNILMSPQGPRVIDFGIARAAEASTVTSTGKITGSAAYMSPEQAVGQRVGPATDIFSLGALLYYAAVGEPAFGTGPATAMLYRTVHAQVDMTPIHSAELRDLIDACLEKDPEDRPNAYHVAIAASTGEPVTRLPRSTPPTGVHTGSLGATSALGASAYDQLMDQVALATAGRGNPVIETGQIGQQRDPRAGHRGGGGLLRSPSMVQAAAGAALLVALIIGGVVLFTSQDKPNAPTSNVSGEKDGSAPVPTGEGPLVADEDGNLVPADEVLPSGVATSGNTYVTNDDGVLIDPKTRQTVTIKPSRSTGPVKVPTTTKTNDDDDDDDPGADPDDPKPPSSTTTTTAPGPGPTVAPTTTPPGPDPTVAPTTTAPDPEPDPPTTTTTGPATE